MINAQCSMNRDPYLNDIWLFCEDLKDFLQIFGDL